jgi:hypothetical protein
MIEHLTKVKNILMIPKAYLRDKKNNTKVVRDIVLFLMQESVTQCSSNTNTSQTAALDLTSALKGTISRDGKMA